MSDRIARLRAALPELGAGELPRHATGQRPLPHGLRELERRARRRAPTRSCSPPTAGTWSRPRALEGVEVVQADRDLLGWLGGRLDELAEAPVAFEADHVTVAGHESLASRAAPSSCRRPASSQRLRAVKDEGELEAIRRAARVTDAVYERLAQEPLVGRSEAEVAWWIEQTLREEGAEAPAFAAIVASGPNAALPHHHPGDRRIGPGETVIVDAGAQVGGYCSDCTRTFATGAAARRAPARLRALPLGAGDRARGRARRRAPRSDLDGIARTRDRGVRPRARPARPRPRRRPRGARAAGAAPDLDRHARRGQRRHRRAGRLPGRAGRRQDRGPRRRGRETAPRSLTGLHEGPADASTRIAAAVAETVSTNQFKNGMHVEVDGQVWRIVEFQHVKPGKGGAFVRTKLKSVGTGAVVDKTFRAGEKMPRIRTETKNVQYLYDAGDDVIFMDEETYEQLTLPRGDVAEELDFLQPSSSVQLLVVDGSPAGVQLPAVGRARGQRDRAGRRGATRSRT